MAKHVKWQGNSADLPQRERRVRYVGTGQEGSAYQRYEQKENTAGRTVTVEDTLPASERKNTSSNARPFLTRAVKSDEKVVVSPGGTFLGGFSIGSGKKIKEKTAAERALEAQVSAEGYKEYQRLATMDLDAQEAAVNAAKANMAKAAPKYNVHAFGGYDATPTSEETTYNRLLADLNKAKSIQYDIKGRQALDALTADQTDALARLGKASRTPAAAMATNRANDEAAEKAKTELLASGLTEEKIRELLNYQQNIPKREKNAKEYEDWKAAGETYAATNPVLATIASVGTNLVSGVGAIGSALERMVDPNTPVDYHGGAYLPYAYTSGVRDTVSQTLEADHGAGASFAYGVGTSMLDSAATVGLTALGVPAWAASSTLGGAAATAAVQEAKERGLDDDHAIWTGLLAGVAETAFEKISLENLITMKAPTGTARQKIAGAVKNAAIQAGIEGSEEVFTDFANLITDGMINGGLSKIRQEMDGYIAEGATESEARSKATGNWLKDTAIDFAAGALAGGIMGSAGNAIASETQYARLRDEYSGQVGEFIAESQELLPDNEDAKKLRSKLQTRAKDGKRISGRDIEKLLQMNEEATFTNDEAKIQSAVKDRLTALGEKGDTDLIAQAVAKRTIGKNVEADAAAALENSKYGQRVLNELNPENVKVDEKGEPRDTYSSSWTGSIGTSAINPITYNRNTRVTGAKYNPETQKMDAIVTDASGEIKTVPADQAKLTPVQEELFDWADGMKEAGSALVGAYQPEQNLELYARSFKLAYEYGKAGVPTEYVEKSEGVNYLYPTQLKLAYEEGQKAAQSRLQAPEEKISSGGAQTATAKKKPSVSLRGATVGGKTYAPVNKKAMTRRQWASVEAMRAFSRATGVDVVFYQSQANEKGEYEGANGFYKDGTIYLDVNAGKNSTQDVETAVLKTASHELTHFFQQNSPTQYEELKKFVVERLVQQEDMNFEDLVEDKRRRDTGLSYDEAVDELVADACEMMLKDSKAVEQLAKENRSLAQRIADWLRKWVRSIQAAMQDLKAERPESRAMLQYAQELQKLWDDALIAAARNNRGAGTGRVQYSIRTMNGETMTVLDTENDTRSFDAAEKYLKALVNTEHPFSTILVDAQPVYIGKDLPGEYRSSEYTKSMFPNLRTVKMQAATNLDEMLLLAENGEWRENVKDKHKTDAQNGWYRYEARFAVPVLTVEKTVDHYTVYGGMLLIRNDADGKSYLYDLVDIKKEKRISPASFSAQGRSEVKWPKPSQTQYMQNAENSQAENSGRTKFSLREPVEETRDLLALHNLTEKNLRSALKLGGLPMPSIAIVKAKSGHDQYGPISIVFRKETIDPQFFRSNKVYGYDAWTPTAPRIEYEVNEKAAQQLRDLYYRMQREKGHDFAAPLYSVANTLEDELNNKGGLDKVVDPMRDNTRIMQIYLEDTGAGSVPDVMRKKVTRMSDGEIEMAEYLAKALGEKTIRSIGAQAGEAPFSARRRWFAEHGEAVNDALTAYYEKEGLPRDEALRVVEAETTASKIRYVLSARKYLNGNTEVVTEEVDRAATDKAIREKVDQNAYDQWLENLFSGVVENSGIYNGKDYYTESGNRRSFSATHYEINLENIVRAMKRGEQTGTGTFFGGQAIWGVTAKDYKSVDEIKADSGRLQKLPEEEYSRIRQQYTERLADITREIMARNIGNEFVASDDAASAIVETLRTKHTVKAIDKELRTYPSLRIQPDTAQKVFDLCRDIANMPTGYFEAKPQRAVSFDEAAAVVVPDNLPDDLRQSLDKLGVTVREYRAGDEQSRLTAVNEDETVRFSKREKYWRPKLSSDEWNLLNRRMDAEIRSDENFVDESTKWVYADEKGVQVFALYGIGDGTEATPLYAVGGKQAVKEAKNINVYMEDSNNDRSTVDFERWLETRQHSRMGQGGGVLQSSRGGRNGDENGRIHSGQQERNAGGAAERGHADQRRVTVRNQQREPRLSNRSVLSLAAEMALRQKNPSWTLEDRNRLEIFSVKLWRVREAEAELKALREEREVLLAGRKMAEVKGEERDELLKNKNRIDIAKGKVERLDSALYEIESKAVIKTLLQKSRSIVEQEAATRARQEYREKRLESEQMAVTRRKIERNAKRLMERMTTNTDKKHIPEALKKPIGELLESLNFYSNSARKGGYITKADRKYCEALEDLRNVLSNQRAYNEGGQADEQFNGYLDLPKGFEEKLSEHKKRVEEALKNRPLKTDIVKEMDLTDLKDLDVILSVMTRSVTKMNEMFANRRFAYVSDAAESSINAMRALGQHQDRKGEDFALWSNTLPWYAFQRFGEGGQSVFEGLQNGWDRLAFNTKVILDFREGLVSDAKARKWDTEVHTVELFDPDGKKVTAGLTTTQLMSLHCLAKRKQALGHLLGGGIRPSAIELTEKKTDKLLKKNLKQDKQFKLTEESMGQLLNLLTPEQVQVADAMQKFMTEQGSAWGNEVSMARFGYRAFTELNYFPIETDSQDRPAGAGNPKDGSLYRLQNISAVKPLTKNANNALILKGIFDVFADHTADMAKYNALVLPIIDAQKWYSYKYASKNEAEQVSTRTVQRAMTKAYGSGANNYVIKFLQDLNGVKETGDRGTDWPTKMISNYKRAMVAANMRVAVLQPTAYVRASAVIDYKYLAAAFADKTGTKQATAEMNQYSGIALWKSLGYFDTDVGRSIRDKVKGKSSKLENIVDKTMEPAGKGDEITWARLWRACKLEVQSTQKLTGEKLLEATAERFREVVYRTQVVDSTMTRSHMMRGSGAFTKIATSFMSEPTLSYNLVMESTRQIAEDAKSLGMRVAIRKNWKTAGRAYQAYVVSAVVTAIVESLFDALRDTDDDKYLDKVWKAFGGEKPETVKDAILNVIFGLNGNLAGDLNPISKLPFARDVVSIFGGYSNERTDTAAFSELEKAIAIWDEVIRLQNGDLDKATETTYYGNMTTYGMIYPTAKALSLLTGLPGSSFTRDVITGFNSVMELGGWQEHKVRTYESKKVREAWDEYGKASGISYAAMARAADAMRDIEGDKDEDGNTISGSQKAKYVEYIRSLGLTKAQEKAVWKAAKVTSWSDKGTPWE